MSCTRRSGSSHPARSVTAVTVALGLTLLPPTIAAQVQPADTVMTNAYIYTVDKTRRVAESIAIDDGRIVYIGDDPGAGLHIDDHTQVVDLKGRMVMPGIHDGHLHPLGLGRTLSERPIILRKSCGHLSLANSRALELAGITAETPDPPGGEDPARRARRTNGG